MLHVVILGFASLLLLLQFTRPLAIDLVPYAAIAAAADAWLSHAGL
jgi:hypothetical protein